MRSSRPQLGHSDEATHDAIAIAEEADEAIAEAGEQGDPEGVPNGAAPSAMRRRARTHDVAAPGLRNTRELLPNESGDSTGAWRTIEGTEMMVDSPGLLCMLDGRPRGEFG